MIREVVCRGSTAGLATSSEEEQQDQPHHRQRISSRIKDNIVGGAAESRTMLEEEQKDQPHHRQMMSSRIKTIVVGGAAGSTTSTKEYQRKNLRLQGPAAGLTHHCQRIDESYCIIRRRKGDRSLRRDLQKLKYHQIQVAYFLIVLQQ